MQSGREMCAPLDHLRNRLNVKALFGVARMLEGILLGLIVFAVGYTLAMRLMARRADVLHGEFIQNDGVNPAEATSSWMAMIQRYMPGFRISARH
jgi:fatty acid desaturase